MSMLYRNSLRRSLALVGHYGSAEEAWRHIDESGMAEAMARAEQEQEWIEAHGIRVWTLSDEDYPYRLRQCPDKPLLLYGKGKQPKLHHPLKAEVRPLVPPRLASENLPIPAQS